MNNSDFFSIAGIVGIIAIVLGWWLKSKLDSSIKYTYDQLLELFKAEQKRSDVLLSERLTAYKLLSEKLLALRRYCNARCAEVINSGSEFETRTENLPEEERISILQHYDAIQRALEERELIVSPCSRQRFDDLFASMNTGMTVELHADSSPDGQAIMPGDADQVYFSIIARVNDVKMALYADLGFPEHISAPNTSLRGTRPTAERR